MKCWRLFSILGLRLFSKRINERKDRRVDFSSRMWRCTYRAIPAVDEDDESDDEYAAILNERRIVPGTSAGLAPKTTIIQEYTLYRDAELKSNKKSDPLDWWKVNAVKYPKLGKLVWKYLSAPATSVPSERLFSEVAAISDARRSRLKPEKVETILFIRGNVPIFNFNSI